MIKKISVILCLCLGLTFVACEKEITNEKTQTNKSATTEPVETEKKVVEAPVVKEITLSTYTANLDTYAVEKLSDIKVKEDSTLQEKLTAVANEISTKVFKGLPITIVKIDTTNGVKKAIINLEEKEGLDANASWSRGYLQGSAGGTITSKTLIETFTQKTYTGEWVDSIEFKYNGGKVEFQHAPLLESTINRK